MRAAAAAGRPPRRPPEKPRPVRNGRGPCRPPGARARTRPHRRALALPAPQAPVGVAEPQPPAPPIAAPVGRRAGAGAGAGPAAAAAVELPSTDADYLQNPKPPYPPMSRRLREQGKVLVRVQISADGTAQRGAAQAVQRLRAAGPGRAGTVRKWRYVPGKRGGVPETMWFDVPSISCWM